MTSYLQLEGPHFELDIDSEVYPPLLRQLDRPPLRLYGIGDAAALAPGLAVIGARKATPYGLSCARRFAGLGALRGVVIVSGGARGCDQEAHAAALEAGARTVVVFGGGADVCYPRRGKALFDEVIAAGGAVVSEQPWGMQPLPSMFPQRNRIIAGLSMMLLIAEAGLPSGTFSTADAALAQGKEVAVVPGAITSPHSRGSNRLMLQGATPVVDAESFNDALDHAFELLPLSMFERDEAEQVETTADGALGVDPVLAALAADAYTAGELSAYFGFSSAELSCRLSQLEMAGEVQRGRDGRYMVCVKGSSSASGKKA